MCSRRCSRGAFIKVEWLLIIAFATLLLQVIPLLGIGVLWAIDMRHWPRGVWIGLNIGVVLILFGFRFAPEMFDGSRMTGKRVAGKREKQEKQLTSKEERELYERMREARKRQVV